MVDITAHLIKIRDAAALAGTATDPTELQAAIQDALSASDALVEYACASADDDLLECAEQAKNLLSELAKGGNDQQRAQEGLMEMLVTLASAYELDLGPGADQASPDGPIVVESEAADGEGDDRNDISAEPIQAAAPEEAQVELPPVAPAAAPPPPMQATPPTADSEEDEARDPEILAEFIIESLEHLAEAEQHLLTLDGDPTNSEGLRALFRGFHTIKGLAGFLNYPSIEALAHAAEDVLAMARDADQPLPDGASDVILETVDRLQKALHTIREGSPNDPDAPADTHADLVDRLRSLAGHPAPAMAHVPVRVPAPLAPRSAPSAQPEDDESEADSEAENDSPARAARSAANRPVQGRSPRDTLRVDAERLERLVDMVGELVITESMVARALEQAGVSVPGLGRHMTRMAKITRELHELAGSLRMVPVRSTFRKMARLARDVARKSGKTVSFKVLGEEAELDKTLVDRIGDPLVHMVRNAIDHGLELDPEDRLKAGKPEAGQVVLRAVHRGGSVHIEVQDDGRGLDPAKIRARALERGLIRESDVLDNRDIISLICEPGFSTAEHVTSISGRGVGMDVVRQQIESMNGTLLVTSELGKGTCFSMQLPLTLAVIDGMVMRLGGQRYVVPTLSVVRLVQPQEAQVYSVLARGEVLQLGDELIPVVRPEELFGIDPAADSARLAVVIELDKGKVAMLVDELLGQQQVVIKSLGDGLGDVPGIAGCAIMPDGRVGLVLDVAGIIRSRQATTDLQEAS